MILAKGRLFQGVLFTNVAIGVHLTVRLSLALRDRNNLLAISELEAHTTI
ncbi:hypothetical protein IQ247_07015 [Plectonema cf. radiosum LEGE 06105]|uniref:Uncharacterized protein n=1 Tax=Plectonema cf. radiosum LEGE 06105 TaxID=945769 RepID=A0A8J7F6Q1_9CYAN|nr:hypothetical protein [Plectonema radiosum]MBE9212464.1 hypothetical protein [Plectonema cf. radiosum LEGE 06105]